MLTGRLSPSAQGWLADHAVVGGGVVPGAGFVELAIRAGDEVGCAVVEELTLQAPLVLPAVGIGCGAGSGRGRRRVGPARACRSFRAPRPDAGWVCSRRGSLSAGSVEPTADLSVWPPAGAVAVDVADGYERLAERGYGYGPAFRGLTAMWRRGDEVFAEVALPDAAGGVGGFGVHPALLDAALHAAVMARTDGGASWSLPFSWQGVSLHAAGASAVRARIAPTGHRRVVDRTGRRVGVAGAVGGVDGGPPGERAAAAGRGIGGIGLRARPAVRGGLVAGVRSVSAACCRPVLRGVRIRCRVHDDPVAEALRAHAPGAGRRAVLAGRATTPECWWW